MALIGLAVPQIIMVCIEDFRRAKDPLWQGSQISVVRESKRAGHCFKQFSDGSVEILQKDRRTVSLPDGITIHETSDGLQVNHCSGVVAQIELDDLHIGDGLSFKYYGRLLRLYADGHTYVYESLLDEHSTASHFRLRVDREGLTMEQI